MTNFLPTTSTVVIDSNLAVWTVLPSVAQEDVVDLFVTWHKQGKRIVAPDLWLSESTSVIRRLVFHKIISPAQGKTAIDDLFSLGVETTPLDKVLCQRAFEWAERFRQAKIYDSLYVALAEQLGAELWTADKRLVNRAAQIGVTWIHWVGESK